MAVINTTSIVYVFYRSNHYHKICIGNDDKCNEFLTFKWVSPIKDYNNGFLWRKVTYKKIRKILSD